MLEKGELSVSGQVSHVVGDTWQQLLPPTVSLTVNSSRSHMQRGERGVLEIKQRLPPDIVTNIRNLAGKDANFLFSHVEVTVSTRFPYGVPTQEDSTWKFHLSDGNLWKGEWKSQVPENLG